MIINNQTFDLLVTANLDWCGLFITEDAGKEFWRMTCSCGVTVTYPINGLPEISTKHPCDNPDHWTIKFVS